MLNPYVFHMFFFVNFLLVRSFRSPLGEFHQPVGSGELRRYPRPEPVYLSLRRGDSEGNTWNRRWNPWEERMGSHGIWIWHDLYDYIVYIYIYIYYIIYYNIYYVIYIYICSIDMPRTCRFHVARKRLEVCKWGRGIKDWPRGTSENVGEMEL